MIDDSFPEPPVRHSENGELETTLHAAVSPVEIAGREYVTQNYEGVVPGPTLVVCPGDRLTVHLENGLTDGGKARAVHDVHAQNAHPYKAAVAPIKSPRAQPTNLHTHGFHVSPRGRGDNVFVNINPGDQFTYQYDLPEDHPPGYYWYHPHRHGFVEGQIFRGMLGAIVVEGGLDEVPELRDIPVRNMVIHYTQLGDDGRVVKVEKSEDEKSKLYLNGAYQPRIPIQPGQLQRWRIANTSDNPVVPLKLEGGSFYLLANDGNTVDEVTERGKLLMGPGERREVLVQGGPAGEYELKSLAFSQFQGGSVPEATVATLVSDGPEIDDELPAGLELDGEQDLRDEPIDERHTVAFTEEQAKNGQFAFLLNGKVFDADRIDQKMRLGEVSEWTLRNETTEWHTFHIHVNDFQVTAVKGRAPKGVSDGAVRDLGGGDVDPEDTVKLPPGKTVKILTRPTGYTGKFVFHCHMAFHEDHGMMGTVKVTE